MDSEDEHEQDQDEGEGGSETSTTLTGFLFGNVNKKGELESDVLDEVRCVVMWFGYKYIYLVIF